LPKKYSKGMPPSRAEARHADLPPVPQGLADPAPGICCLGSWPGARGGPNALACQLLRQVSTT